MPRTNPALSVGYCGLILLAAALLPKLAALLSLAPAPVAGHALCVGLGGQIGIGIAVVVSNPLASKDYFVVGVTLLFGTNSTLRASQGPDQSP